MTLASTTFTMISRKLENVPWPWQRKDFCFTTFRLLYQKEVLTLTTSVKGLSLRISLLFSWYNDLSSSNRIIRLQGTGLPQIWTNWFVPKSNQCVRFNTKAAKPRLSVNHLISAFVLLAMGFGLSFIVFLFELIAAGRLSVHKGSHDNN